MREPLNDEHNARTREAPYHWRYELWYFFRHGLPLGFAAVLEWGVPPVFSIVLAGHVPQSADLQASLGFARVFWSCSCNMVIWGLNAYILSVIPGCIGAGRMDRIPAYFWRSVLFSTFALIPSLICCWFAGEIMGLVGVEDRLLPGISTYCRLMSVTAVMLLLECQVEQLFMNLGYSRAAAFNSLVTGMGVDVVVTYLFIYRWELGMRGAALVQICIKASRLVVWALLACWFQLGRVMFVFPRNRERLFTLTEARIFVNLSVPAVLSTLSSEFVFELQILALAHIAGLPSKAIAAGAVWVQFAQLCSACQMGWAQATSMRALKLLGAQDRGAPWAYSFMCILSALLVGVSNLPLLVCTESISAVISNDPEVQRWFGKLLWVLTLHQQTRMSYNNAFSLFNPIGLGYVRLGANLVAFYLLAVPFAFVMAFTDLATHSLLAKMCAVMGATALAQTVLVLFGFGVLTCSDWSKLSLIIERRAQSDNQPGAASAQETLPVRLPLRSPDEELSPPLVVN